MNKAAAQYICSPENLTLFFYGELDATEHRQVERHLKECAACRKELAQLRTMLENLPEKQLKISQAEILSFNKRVTSRIRPRYNRPFRPVMGWSLAGAVLAALLFVTFRPPMPDQNQSSPTMPLHMISEFNEMPEAEMLLNLELLQNLDMLQELEEAAG